MISKITTKTDKRCETCNGFLYIVSQSSFISKSRYIKLRCLECNYETIETITIRSKTF
jgi:hypothetical protein